MNKKRNVDSGRKSARPDYIQKTISQKSLGKCRGKVIKTGGIIILVLLLGFAGNKFFLSVSKTDSGKVKAVSASGADEEKEELQEAGCSLGTGDRAMQKANLDRYEARLVQRIAELQKGLPERKRLCQSLGIMGGLFLFLILV